MNDDTDKLDEVANDIDELKTAVEELADNRGNQFDPATVRSLREALDEAGDAADRLENESDQAERRLTSFNRKLFTRESSGSD